MTEFDELADNYDETRGGEQRGHDYASDIDSYLPAGENPVLEIGVGTGVVALGLHRLGRKVIGLDLSAPMLAKAKARLGSVLILSDALQMALPTASMAHAVSVWVVHSVKDPMRLFAEAARVIRPGGRYVVCSNQQPAPDDVIGGIINEMILRVDVLRGANRPRGVTSEEVLGWAAQTGFTGSVHHLERRWFSTTGGELAAIRYRTWPVMRELDDDRIEEATRPAIEALEALPVTEHLRRATAEIVVLLRP